MALEARTNIDDEILACEEALRQAQLTSDVEALNHLISDELVFTSFDGSLATKDDDLSLHRSGRLRITRMEPVERRVLHLGVTSIVSVKMDAAAIVDGVPISGMLRYTRVWHQRAGKWQVVAGHMSSVPA